MAVVSREILVPGRVIHEGGEVRREARPSGGGEDYIATNSFLVPDVMPEKMGCPSQWNLSGLRVQPGGPVTWRGLHGGLVAMHLTFGRQMCFTFLRHQLLDSLATGRDLLAEVLVPPHSSLPTSLLYFHEVHLAFDFELRPEEVYIESSQPERRQLSTRAPLWTPHVAVFAESSLLPAACGGMDVPVRGHWISADFALANDAMRRLGSLLVKHAAQGELTTADGRRITPEEIVAGAEAPPFPARIHNTLRFAFGMAGLFLVAYRSDNTCWLARHAVTPRYRAAARIQEAWRRARDDPTHVVNRRRLLKESSELRREP